ncbi:MAG: hypothetical protein MUF34_25710 [Polyangiaceae bacterium]|jgi:hypothetical protein|nr:hypothetical protein [Polyangiaceae bacterium]
MARVPRFENLEVRGRKPVRGDARDAKSVPGDQADGDNARESQTLPCRRRAVSR